MQAGNTEVIVGIIGGTVIMLVLVISIITFMLVYQKKHHQHQKEIITMKAKFEREILKAQLEIQEQTLKNISREIHDNIGQMLSLIKLQLNTLPIAENGEPSEKIKDTKELVSQVINDLRDISKSLDTSRIAEIGLEESLRAELERVKRTGYFNPDLQVKGTAHKFDPRKELILFRMVQEALNNIIKHAKAKNMSVVLDYLPGSLALTITDDGVGFDAEAMLRRGWTEERGAGLKNIHSRAELINATLDISSIPLKGTAITIHLNY